MSKTGELAEEPVVLSDRVGAPWLGIEQTHSMT